MTNSGGVPGIAVAMAGGAVLLMYAGYRGTDPLTALREVATGQPKGVTQASATREALYTGIDAPGGSGGGAGGGVTQAGLNVGAGAHPEFVRAASRFQGDQYSQARRWQSGYSDCSSFVGKALKASGVTPPGGSTTGSYLVWRRCVTVPRSSIGAGDFLVSGGHMALAVSSSMAIGQQNARQNVEVGPIDQIMAGQGGWVARRYTGKSGGSASA
ncbi:hypothetical protein [Streptomyces sp. NBC_00470]|uniref:hypothetical protein n=1 Tax=Streptomyces sp. NBC_00470 TaxID=2975753 RepID=UPI0030E263C7